MCTVAIFQSKLYPVMEQQCPVCSTLFDHISDVYSITDPSFHVRTEIELTRSFIISAIRLLNLLNVIHGINSEFLMNSLYIIKYVVFSVWNTNNVFKINNNNKYIDEMLSVYVNFTKHKVIRHIIIMQSETMSWCGLLFLCVMYWKKESTKLFSCCLA